MASCQSFTAESMKHHTQKPLPPDNRTVTIGARSWESLWADALKPRTSEQRPAGAGWKSTQELMRELKLTRIGVRCRMDSLILRGRIERTTGRSPSGQRVAFYRPIPNKPPTAPALL